MSICDPFQGAIIAMRADEQRDFMKWLGARFASARQGHAMAVVGENVTIKRLRLTIEAGGKCGSRDSALAKASENQRDSENSRAGRAK